MTALEGEYEPSRVGWVREQVELYESSGGTEGTTLPESGYPVVIVTMRGATSGKIRKVPLMRVEHDGAYAAIASRGGADEHPQWFYNLVAHPEVELQDATDKWPMRARRLTGFEREAWYERGIAAFPPYDDYRKRAAREIPVFLLER